MSLPTEDQRLLVDAAREFLTERAGTGRLRAAVESESGHDHELWRQVSDLGWTALPLPDAVGGLDASLTDIACVVEECGRMLMPSALTGALAAAWTLSRHAAPEHRAVLFPKLACGERIAVWSSAVWSSAALDADGALRATGAADGGLSMSGTLRHVPDGIVADDVLVDVATPAGPALALIPLDRPGVSRRRHGSLDLTRRYAELAFVDVELYEVPMLRGRAPDDLWRCGVVLQCAESIGVAARALDLTIAHVRQRTQFGRAIGSFQAVKHRIADMYIELEGSRVATRDAAESVEAGRADAAYAVHTAKSWTARAAGMITSEAVQLHGGIGFTWEHDLHLLQRRAKANELLLGSPGWHDEQLTVLLRAAAP